MANQGNSASYWFEKDAAENQNVGAAAAEPVKRRIPSPLNLFARRLRAREETPVPAEAPIEASDAPAVDDMSAATAFDAPQPEAMAPATDDQTAAAVMAAMSPAETSDAGIAPAAPVAQELEIEAASMPTPADTAEPIVAEAPAEPAPTAPVVAVEVPAAPAPMPMQSERVALQAAPPVPEAPAAEPAPRRASRVKTTFLGFERSDGRIEDIFQKEEKAPASQAVQFPVGWIVVIDGPGRGNAIALQAGVSQMGRGEDQAIQLDFGDMAISRQNHAAIAFDHEERKFYLGHGGKTNIVRLNGKPVLSTEALDNGDKIKIGETTMQFVAFCGPNFHWTA